MNVEALILELIKIEDKSKEVYVWTDNNGLFQTNEFTVCEDEDGDITIE